MRFSRRRRRLDIPHDAVRPGRGTPVVEGRIRPPATMHATRSLPCPATTGRPGERLCVCFCVCERACMRVRARACVQAGVHAIAGMCLRAHARACPRICVCAVKARASSDANHKLQLLAIRAGRPPSPQRRSAPALHTRQAPGAAAAAAAAAAGGLACKAEAAREDSSGRLPWGRREVSQGRPGERIAKGPQARVIARSTDPAGRVGGGLQIEGRAVM